MMKFLILIILFFVALFVIVPSVIFGIIRFLITMLGGSSSSHRGGQRQGGYSGHASASDNGYTFEQSDEPLRRAKRKKVFDENEGEYVSFEEIKPSDDK